MASYIIKFDFDNEFVCTTENMNYVYMHNVMHMFGFRAIGDTTFMVDKPENGHRYLCLGCGTASNF